ncbi:SufS family cysteine desulfurase [Collinsella sp. AGMB00827]|uniref:cysteine desulfurase n=1 Tax=Collinsella ureilytica TaxID=2869515 RepID=A0ABS7MI65_9ACTN|nr:SufS family cysteine desulfurase [Collinsella urealyticum]MBY4797008.1 SufS family cysteine desulfurase [Collinsella urealyticum]
MIDAENVACETCTAPGELVFDASDEASRAWPKIDIAKNPYKADFPLLAARPDLSFLDSAATSQRPASVLDAQRHFYESMNANPLRGLYSLSVEATEAIEKVRTQVARFIGADTAAEHSASGSDASRDIIFLRNTSEALNLVAKSFAPLVLSEGDEIALTIMEHHSNLIPWQEVARKTGAHLVYLRPSATGELSAQEIAEKIGKRTKIVAVGHVSNVMGVENPVAALACAAHKHGAYVVVDAAQSVLHMPIDVQALGADFLAFSAHKALGPMGVGVLWGRHELLERMPPMLTGGEMIDSVTEEAAVWAPVPEKFEAGTQDAAGIYALGAALRYITDEVGYESIQTRERALVHYLMSRMVELPFVDIIGSIYWDRHHGVVSFNVQGIHPHDVASILDAEGVCIRAGHHCAQPLLAWLQVEHRACCRASLAFYNDARDIDAFIAGLKKVWEVFHG